MLYFLISLDGHLQAGQPLVGTMAANIQTQAQKWGIGFHPSYGFSAH